MANVEREDSIEHGYKAITEIKKSYMDLKKQYKAAQGVIDRLNTEKCELIKEVDALKKKCEELRQYASDLEQKYSGILVGQAEYKLQPEPAKEAECGLTDEPVFKRGELVWVRDNASWFPAIFLEKMSEGLCITTNFEGRQRVYKDCRRIYDPTIPGRDIGWAYKSKLIQKHYGLCEQ
jgi:predicted RNase H-like nuclease (RuvC/YqgF family)